MRLNKNFLTHKSRDEVIVVPAGNASFSGVVKGNKTLGAILDLLKNETSVEQIVDAMQNEYDAPRDIIENDVVTVINRLRKIGAIDE